MLRISLLFVAVACLFAQTVPSRGPIPMRSPGNDPWFITVPRHAAVAPAEHPRLLFRRAELPALRRKAATPAGQAILQRLRTLLEGPLTIGHAAGHGLLYQLTGDRSHAEAGQRAYQQLLDGAPDRDPRYGYRNPGGALRAGPTLGWMALGYDLCYDGWDAVTRERIGRALADYRVELEVRNGKQAITLAELARATMPPGSNHFGMQVGGAAMALLAVTGEPWADQPRLDTLLREVEPSLLRNLSEAFGDGGFFAEGDGTGSMSSQIIFLSALQAWRNVTGRDYLNGPRPNARMMTLKWIYQTLFRDRAPEFWPIRGGYPHNVWARTGLSGAAYFAQGIGNVLPPQQAAMKWIYERFLAAADAEAGTPFDTASVYPHYAVAAFVNWPLDLPAQDPNQIFPRAYRDVACGFYCWRNRWRDADDTVITVLTNETRGYMGAKPDAALSINAGGRHLTWGSVSPGAARHWSMSPLGETSSLTLAGGEAFAIDFSGTSGVGVLLVTTGKAEGTSVELAGTTLTFFSPHGALPAIRVDGNAAIIGRQRVTIENGNLKLAVAGR